MSFKKKNLKLAIIGLGYVGLPLALEFEKKKNVLGFDINERRVKELKSGKDRNLEFSKDQLKVLKVKFTSNVEDLKSVNVILLPYQLQLTI